jgi:hypothetical protein
MNFIEEEGRDFFIDLNKYDVRFLIVGGIAVNYYGYSRATGDIDIWIEDTETNRKNLVLALLAYGIEGAEAFYTHPLLAGYSELLIGSGIYVDLMSELQFFRKEDFADSYEKAETFMLENKIPLKVIHINRLLEEKKKSSRPKDQDDAGELEKIILSRKK